MKKAGVRRATRADGVELARLRWEFTAEDGEAPTEPLDAFASSFTQTWAGFWASGRWRVWVAEAGGRLIGCVWMEWVDKVPRPRPRPNSIGYVTNVYVSPAWRNGGIGSRLLGAAIDDARRVGHAQLFLWPTERSRPFYARAGFAPSTEVQELSLAQDEP